VNWAYLKSKASVLLKNPYINGLRGVPLPQATGEAAQLEIGRALLRGGVLVARVGETEGAATKQYLLQRHARSGPLAPYDAAVVERLKATAGFFPTTDDAIDELSRLYLRAIDEIDIYAAWTRHDAALCPPAARRVRLIDLDPFFTTVRWTLALAGRRICIVNPFVDTMTAQYPRRAALFDRPVLPDFDLVFVRAPMTHCESEVGQQTWLGNLQHMQDQVSELDPDILIIGAGAYGLPLGAAAKAAGRSAVVLGGSTQLLFGIKGNRWENDRQYRRLFNEHWVRPSEGERPAGFSAMEIKGGAYW
jgi:hypothetical protein